VSLQIFDALGVAQEAGIIDVGGGTSTLVDALIRRGFTDLTVLDISKTALSASRERLGAQSSVTWVEADLLAWAPARLYDVWHDRAVFHFLSSTEVETYRDLLLEALIPGGLAIMATFAPDGPERCSGLPVTRYSAEQIAAVLGSDLEVVDQRREAHTTPSGAVQPFTWIAARRVPL
jgi:trans-aconitate methyltransferase